MRQNRRLEHLLASLLYRLTLRCTSGPTTSGAPTFDFETRSRLKTHCIPGYKAEPDLEVRSVPKAMEHHVRFGGSSSSETTQSIWNGGVVGFPTNLVDQGKGKGRGGERRRGGDSHGSRTEKHGASADGMWNMKCEMGYSKSAIRHQDIARVGAASATTPGCSIDRRVDIAIESIIKGLVYRICHKQSGAVLLLARKHPIPMGRQAIHLASGCLIRRADRAQSQFVGDGFFPFPGAVMRKRGCTVNQVHLS